MTRLISFYLPQFHPTPENDSWWGKGFTEWTNVGRARPLFPGHRQPRVPADLGYYDLRLGEAQAAQAELAREYGVHGFCYYHYWFGGRRILERPLEQVLRTGAPDLPFCLCWANETWSRRWSGEHTNVLMEQVYPGDADDLAHIRSLLAALADPRAIRVRGRPIFLVYRPLDLPHPRRTTDIWRAEVVRHGLKEPYLIAVNHRNIDVPPQSLGFDAFTDFTPNWDQLYGLRNLLPRNPVVRRFRGLARHLGFLPRRGTYGWLQVLDYAAAAEASAAVLGTRRPYPYFPCVTPRWDNSPRRKERALVLVNDDPQAYGRWLARAIDYVAGRSEDERIVFVNAWNEWGEGNYLEPDLEFGRRYLEATRAALADGFPR